MMNENLSVELLIKSFIDSEKNENLAEILKQISDNKFICKNYSEISQVIYALKNDEFTKLINYFGLKSRNDVNHFDGVVDSLSISDKNRDNLQHFGRHIELSCLQRRYIEKITEDVTEEAETARRKVQKIYSEFVGILGVFTALSFALMGSVQVFGNILNNVTDPNRKTIGFVLVVAGIYMILIYFVVMTLFIGMKKIFGIDGEYRFNVKFTRCMLGVSGILILIGVIGVYFI